MQTSHPQQSVEITIRGDNLVNTCGLPQDVRLKHKVPQLRYANDVYMAIPHAGVQMVRFPVGPVSHKKDVSSSSIFSDATSVPESRIRRQATKLR